MNRAGGNTLTIKGILFDLDGTLIDTTELILQSFDHTIQTHFDQPADREIVIRYFGRPLREAFTHMAPGREDDLITTYRAFNLEQHDRLTRAYPTVSDTVQQLKQSGYKLGVVTSKFSASALRGLQLFGLDAYFDSIIGVDKCTYHKPHPEPVQIGAKSLGLTPAECLMVGDAPADLLSAAAAGSLSAAVKWTLVPWTDIQAAQPTYVLEQMSDLLPLLNQ